MFADSELMTIIEEVDVLVAEIRESNSAGPHFRILHRFHAPGSDCAPGEEVAGIYLIHHGREYFVRLPLALRLLFDYLAHHSRLPQSAAQIEAGIRADRFYKQHTNAVMGKGKFIRSIPRSYVRVYIDRLRSALEITLRDAGLAIDVRRVLLSQETVMNEVGYQLKATFEWTHIDIVKQKFNRMLGTTVSEYEWPSRTRRHAF